jgi:hypothetical protein
MKAFRLLVCSLGIVLLCAAPASAQWRHGGGGGWHGQWHGGGTGFPQGGALLGGAILGGVLGGLLAPNPVYVAPPVYVQPPVYAQPPIDPVAYCAARFRSYNPATGLYLGFDGAYHPCP